MKLNYVILLAISLTAVIYVTGCVSQEPKGKDNGVLDNCKTGNYDEERDCYTALAYKNVDYKICEKMPEDVNERQANKAFCLGFIASVTGDLSICRNQGNMYYKNTCEIVFERYTFDINYIEEFEDIKNKYSG